MQFILTEAEYNELKTVRQQRITSDTKKATTSLYTSSKPHSSVTRLELRQNTTTMGVHPRC